MKPIKAICKVIDTINDYLGRLFSLLVLGVLAVILIEVILRRLFNMPQIWTQELMICLSACYIILIVAYGFQKKAFVMVDVLFAKLPIMGQYILHLITYVVYLIPFAFWITPRTWTFFIKSYQQNEKAYSVWSEPVWPVKLCFAIGMTLLCVQTVSEILKQLDGIIETAKGGNKPAAKEAE